MSEASTHWHSPYWASWVSPTLDWIAQIAVFNPGPFDAEVELQWLFDGNVKTDSFTLGENERVLMQAPSGTAAGPESHDGSLRIVSTNPVGVWGVTPFGGAKMGWVNMSFYVDPTIKIRDIHPQP